MVTIGYTIVWADGHPASHIDFEDGYNSALATLRNRWPKSHLGEPQIYAGGKIMVPVFRDSDADTAGAELLIYFPESWQRKEATAHANAIHLFVPIFEGTTARRDVCHRCGLERHVDILNGRWIKTTYHARDDNREVALDKSWCVAHEDGPFFNLDLKRSQIMREVEETMGTEMSMGYCARCGLSSDHCGPDELRELCEYCGAFAVYGASRLLDIFERQGRT